MLREVVERRRVTQEPAGAQQVGAEEPSGADVAAQGTGLLASHPAMVPTGRDAETGASVVPGRDGCAGRGVAGVGPTGAAEDEAQALGPARRPCDVPQHVGVLVRGDGTRG